MKVSHYVAAFVAGSLAIASSAAIGCSIAGSIDSPQQLVSGAERIYRARAESYLGAVPTKRGETGQIRFVVLESLKGVLAESIELEGILTESDDPNDRPVPYDFVRPKGRRGNCYALEYARGKEFLLFIRSGTPYWSSLAPTNEQVTGPNDPWVSWVKRQLGMPGAP